jgi:hypothetical protein
LASCNNTNDGSSTDVVTYVIQYTDDAGTHTINVTSGSPYVLTEIPERYGYNFLGLFDAETGGTQFTNAQGASLASFTDNKNMVLFPQFEAKTYTIILDYQGASVTGERELQTYYNATITGLPTSLSLANKTFEGWYTKVNCQGTQVADKYGVLPENKKITEAIYDLTDTNGYIYLYAGFKNVVYNVTFYFESGMTPEIVAVEHGTNISDVRVDTRVNGLAPLTWSKSSNGIAYTGKIEEANLVFYAIEYAPVIEFDSNGGSEVMSIIAKAASTITLPTPTKDLYKFLYWADTQGNQYTSTTMPSESIMLHAVWQAKIVFDENGGSSVDDISQSAGTTIILPTTQKGELVFAGWYTEDKKQYTSTVMSSEGVLLKAGWYTTKTKTIVLFEEGERDYAENTSPLMSDSQIIDLSDIYSTGVRSVTITLHFEMYVSGNAAGSRPTSGCIDIYSQPTASSQFLMWSISKSPIKASAWEEYEESKTMNLSSDKLYYCPYISNSGLYYKAVFKDVYLSIVYPDTTELIF